jgi:hypothetical protein
MSGFYEEVIRFKDLKVKLIILIFIHKQPDEEVNKFYISEDLSETEKLNYIIKKGYVCQKCAVI